MKTVNYIDPDLNFIKEISTAEGASLKKCYQCATCSVACSLSHEQKPFPRKEMLYASWGLKDRLVCDPDIWLCHNCGDCSTRCPRGARPGDVLGAIRKVAIRHYSKPAFLNKLLNRPALLPLLLIIPLVVFLVAGFGTGMTDFSPAKGDIVFASFFPVELIEIIFIPLSALVGLVFLLGLKRFIYDIQTHYQQQGVLSSDQRISMGDYVRAMIRQFTPIIKHDKFSDCSDQNRKKISHMMVSFSFVSLAFVAGVFALALTLFNSHAPYSQFNPIKILANVSGVALIIGSLWMIRDRVRDREKKSSYFDWYLLALALGLGVTGMMTQVTRLLDFPATAYTVYFVHLMMAFNLIAFLPYSKLAHFVYRTVAVTFDSYVRSRL